MILEFFLMNEIPLMRYIDAAYGTHDEYQAAHAMKAGPSADVGGAAELGNR